MSPTRITSKEIRTIRDLYTSRDYAHFSMTSLSLLAKRTGQVFASVATWSRIVKESDLKRVRHRVYPDSPKIGIRASKPFEIWHLDLSVIRLRDGSKAFIQAVIDNYSRYVLAWNVSGDYGGIRTRELLVAAIKKAKNMDCALIPNVFVDSGSENLNGLVDELAQDKLIERTVAQIDVVFSNSMIEMLFQRLKHRHLYNVPLIDLDALERETNFYLTDANNVVPLAVLGGATPWEALSGTWSESRQTGWLESAQIARDQRRLANLARRCKPCLA
jgi:putative transposase